MKKYILLSIEAGLAFAMASAAGAQAASGGPPGGIPTGGVRSQDVAAANRQVDSDYNTLAGRGVKVTNKDRADSPKPSKRGQVVRATAADIKPGMVVRDIKGIPLGTVAALAENEVVSDPNQVVVDTGKTKIGVPLIGLGKDDQGLILNTTAEKFNQLVAQAHASAPAKSN